MCLEHVANRGPCARRVGAAAETGIEPLQLGCLPAEDQAEHTREQPELHHPTRRCVFPPGADRPDRTSSLPVVGHGPNQVPVEMLRVTGVPAHPVREGALQAGWLTHASSPRLTGR